MSTQLTKDSRAASDRARAENAADLAVTVVASAGLFTIVGNVSDMTAITITTSIDGKTIKVLGYYEINDGGGGYFRWDAGSNVDANNGTVFSSNNSVTGRWIRIVGKSINISCFGAIGDGVSDDTLPIQKSVESGIKEIVFNSDNTYLITSTINLVDGISLKSSSSNKAIIKSNTAIQQFSFNHAHKKTSNVTAINGNVATLADISDIDPGDLIVIRSNVLWYYDNRGNTYKGEISRVNAINSLDVILSDTINDTYTIPSETLTAYIYSPKSFSFDNIRFENVKNNPSSFGIGLYYTVDCVFNGCEFINQCTAAVYMYSTIGLNVTECHVEYSNRNGNGYGFWINGVNCHVERSTFINCRGPVDFSSFVNQPPSRYCYINKCESDGGDNLAHDGKALGGRGFGTHGNAEYIFISNSTIKNSNTGILVRGKSIVSQNNRFKNIYSIVYKLSYGASFKAIGDSFLFDKKEEEIDPLTVQLPSVICDIESGYKYATGLEIRDCNLWGMNYAVLATGSGDDSIGNLIIKNNVFNLYQGTSLSRSHIRLYNKPLNNSVILDNKFMGEEPAYVQVVKGTNSFIQDFLPTYEQRFIDDNEFILTHSDTGISLFTGKQIELTFKSTGANSLINMRLMYSSTHTGSNINNVLERSAQIDTNIRFGLYANAITAITKDTSSLLTMLESEVDIVAVGSDNQYKLIIKHPAATTYVQPYYHIRIFFTSPFWTEFVSYEIVPIP